MRKHAMSFICFSSEVSAGLRREMLGYNGFNCYMCGLAAGEVDYTTGQTAYLHVSYVIEKSVGGSDSFSNLRAACSICVEGRKDMATANPNPAWLLSQVRGIDQAEQRVVLDWLCKKFKE